MELDSLPRREAGFIQPMECLAVSRLPDGSNWVYEIKLDGYRAVAINSNGTLSLVSKNRKSFNRQYPYIIEALLNGRGRQSARLSTRPRRRLLEHLVAS